MQEKHAKPDILRLNRNLNELEKTPFGYTLAGMAIVCAAVYAALFIIPDYIGALVLMLGLGCGVTWIVGKVRRAFTYASHDLADFVRGKDKSKPVENPLLRDPFYASIDAQITAAKANHKRVKHLYAKREHRVNELLGKKGVA